MEDNIETSQRQLTFFQGGHGPGTLRYHSPAHECDSQIDQR